MVVYGDFLCPYCRRLGEVFQRLRHALSERLAYTYRYVPNERAHPGAELMSHGAEAAARQGRFWEMYDALFQREPPLNRSILLEIAASLGLDMERFRRDLEDPGLRLRVADDLADGRHNGGSCLRHSGSSRLRRHGPLTWCFACLRSRPPALLSLRTLACLMPRGSFSAPPWGSPSASRSE